MTIKTYKVVNRNVFFFVYALKLFYLYDPRAHFNALRVVHSCLLCTVVSNPCFLNYIVPSSNTLD